MSQRQGMQEVLRVIRKLLGPDGCPWDREQKPDTLCDYLIEEVFELVSAIRSKDPEEVREEMGDVFFLLFFIAGFYDQNFSLDDVWQANAVKMIARHPHVFEDQSFASREDLLRNWEKVKKEEKKGKSRSPFSSIPNSLPPLLTAYRINSKSARIGFTWDKDQDVLKKLDEEWHELMEAINLGDREKTEQELGDYFFALVEYGRRNGIKANTALSKANARFLDRFKKMEALALERGQEVTELTAREMNSLWEEVKSGE